MPHPCVSSAAFQKRRVLHTNNETGNAASSAPAASLASTSSQTPTTTRRTPRRLPLPLPAAFRRLRDWSVLFWSVNLLLCELVLPWFHGLRQYAWPAPQHHAEEYDAHVLVISDPQITDAYSYGHGGIVLRLEEFYCDLYMRRHYRQLLGHLGHTVDAVVFLGDLFDGGRTLEPDSVEYNDHTARFRSIFRLPDPLFPSAGTDGVPASTPEYVFLTGNHDVGQGRYYNPLISAAFQRDYAPTDGLNFVRRIGGVDFVGVNAQALSKKTQRIEQIRYSIRAAQLGQVGLDDVRREGDEGEVFHFPDSAAANSDDGIDMTRSRIGFFGDENDGTAGPRGWSGHAVRLGFQQSWTSGLERFFDYDPEAVRKDGADAYSLVDHLLIKNQAAFEQQSAEAHRPRVLLSHVPLYRPPPNAGDDQCGPLRPAHKRPIRDGSGTSYQNLLSEDLSLLLLRAVRPSLVLSGDDHAACRVTHSWVGLVPDEADPSILAAPRGSDPENSGIGSASCVEETVPTFSWLMGERSPGFAMLSIPSEKSVARGTAAGRVPLPQVKIVFLPEQLPVYIWYALCGILTALVAPVGVLVGVVLRNRNSAEHRYMPLPADGVGGGVCSSLGIGEPAQSSDDGIVGARKRPPRPVSELVCEAAVDAGRAEVQILLAVGGVYALLLFLERWVLDSL